MDWIPDPTGLLIYWPTNCMRKPSRWPSEAVPLSSKLIATDPHDFLEWSKLFLKPAKLEVNPTIRTSGPAICSDGGQPNAQGRLIPQQMAFRDHHTTIKADSHSSPECWYVSYVFPSSNLPIFRTVICPTVMKVWRVDFQGQEPKDIIHL